jgi:hypothetical protein
VLWIGCAGALVIGDIGLASLTVVNWERSLGYTCCGNVLKSFGQDWQSGGYDGMNEVHWSGVKGDRSREVNSSSFFGDEWDLGNSDGLYAWSHPLRAAAALSSLAMTRSWSFAMRSLILRPIFCQWKTYLLCWWQYLTVISLREAVLQSPSFQRILCLVEDILVLRTRRLIFHLHLVECCCGVL